MNVVFCDFVFTIRRRCQPSTAMCSTKLGNQLSPSPRSKKTKNPLKWNIQQGLQWNESKSLNDVTHFFFFFFVFLRKGRILGWLTCQTISKMHSMFNEMEQKSTASINQKASVISSRRLSDFLVIQFWEGPCLTQHILEYDSKTESKTVASPISKFLYRKTRQNWLNKSQTQKWK